MRLWITPIALTSATVASVVLGDTLVICIAGSQPDKILDWITNINHSDGLYDAAAREKFPNLIFHQGVLADVCTSLSRFGSTARGDAETTSGEDGKQEEEEDEEDEAVAAKGQSLDKTIEKYGIKRIVFTGHSKGGGEAQALHMLISQLLALPAEDVNRKNRPVIEALRGPDRQCVAFASPMAFPINYRSRVNDAEAALLNEFFESTTNYVCTMDLVPRLPGDIEWARAALPALKAFAQSKAQNAKALNGGSISKWVFRTNVVPRMVDEFAKKIESMLAPGSLQTSLLDRYQHLCRVVCFKPSVSGDGSMELTQLAACDGEGYLAEAWDGSFATKFPSWPLECHSVVHKRVAEQPKAEARELTEEATEAL
jgi:hypothetical protein